jgi:hypothetical protein
MLNKISFKVAIATLAVLLIACPGVSTDPALKLSANNLTIPLGKTGQTIVNLTRTNLPDQVTLSISEVPSGVTATFSDEKTTGSQVTLTLEVTDAARLGDYTLKISASTA